MSTSTNDATKPQFKTIRKVLNPSTGRYITVGSRKYKELVSSGFLNEHIESKNDTIYEGEDAQKVNKVNQASIVGKKIAEVAALAGIEKVVFDRNGYLYHGRIKSLADSAREGGLKF